MKKSAEYLSDLAAQIESGLITLDEAIDILSGNEKLDDEQQRLVDQAIADCRSSGGAMSRVSNSLTTRDEAYAYHHPGGGIAWGLNSADLGGICIARGIKE